MNRHHIVRGALIAVASAVLLVGCASGGSAAWTYAPASPAASDAAPAASGAAASTAPSPATAAGASLGMIMVEATDDLKFKPAALTVDAPGTYTVEFKNSRRHRPRLHPRGRRDPYRAGRRDRHLRRRRAGRRPALHLLGPRPCRGRHDRHHHGGRRSGSAEWLTTTAVQRPTPARSRPTRTLRSTRSMTRPRPRCLTARSTTSTWSWRRS